MPNLRVAAELLTAGCLPDGLAAIAAALGGRPPLVLDPDARGRLGLAPHQDDVRIATAPGAQRLLLVRVAGTASLREELRRIARQISSRAPHVLWTLLGSQPETRLVAIASWDGAVQPLKLAALIVDSQRVVDSDAETLRALIAAARDRDVSTHARWIELLGREVVTGRFFRVLESSVQAMSQSSAKGSDEDRSLVALLYASRLLFLAFIQAKGWLNGDYELLPHRFDLCMSSGGRFHQRILHPLFFGTLNTPARKRAAAARAFGDVPFLNGGLFAKTAAERRCRGLVFSDETYGSLFRDVFGRFRFTAREESADWSEAAVDPEMLGRVFESLMASRERRTSGTFYTPHHLVRHTSDAAIDRLLARGLGLDRARALRQGELRDSGDRLETRRVLEGLTILDPACGSGAFLVHALEDVARLLRRAGDDRSVSAIRRAVVTRSIFGVDANPIAVWLCELRLWLSVVIEHDATIGDPIHPLPNLDHNVRVGDTLAGLAFGASDAGPTPVRKLRNRYARAVGARKRHLGSVLRRLERDRLVLTLDRELAAIKERRLDLIRARRGRDLFGDRYEAQRQEVVAAKTFRARAASLRTLRQRVLVGGQIPFAWSAHFADVGSGGGFDVILGNPPWVRVHNVSPRERVAYRQGFEVARAGGWRAGADLAGAGRGFAGQIDLAALFVERSIHLLRKGGVCALLLPSKLWRSLAGAGLRRFLLREAAIQQLDDFANADNGFAAVVYPSLLVASKAADPQVQNARSPCLDVSEVRGASTARWRAPLSSIVFDESPGAPWLVLPPQVRRSFDRLNALGVPFADSAVGRPHLGVKCGCNDAFVVRVLCQEQDWATVMATDGRRGTIEADALRALIRGEAIAPWHHATSDLSIVWTEGPDGRPLKVLPPGVARWLAPWRETLTRRSDAKNSRRWWEIFRTHSARADKARVVWADLGRTPRAMLLEKGDWTVPLNSCYVARCDSREDALTLTAILNSAVAAAWLNALAEPARGNYRRYLGWTMAVFPLPRRWEYARSILSPIADECIQGVAHLPESELTRATLEAYGIRARDAAPLIAWLT